ncbi:P-loop containing nucleoside triphosphate hydrolase protein [Serendipita vermifera]|nr:P-loop containing nucleoside triphosphate hydrolase protein [Serendipita vermifera]
MSYLRDSYNYPLHYQIAVLGNYGVGRISIIERSVDDTFWSGNRSAVKPDFGTQLVEIEGKIAKIRLWNISPLYLMGNLSMRMKKMHGFILVFDTTNQRSFDNLGAWMEKIDKAQALVDYPMRGTLVGNKSDLIEQRTIDASLAKEFAEKHGLDFIETSAKVSINVETLVLTLVKRLMETPENRQAESNSLV